MIEPTQLRDVMDRLVNLPVEAATDAARVDQERRWAAGQRIPAEVYLAALPAVAADPEHALVLIYGEVLSRAACGETASLGHFQLRFPHLAERLALQFAVHNALADAQSTLNMAPADAKPAPRRFGDYELLEEIARGGMGVVYRARQISLNRTVALKMISAGRWASPGELRRFRTEAEAVAQLDHPNILPIYEVGECDGQPFFSMKLVHGVTLSMDVKGAGSVVSLQRQRVSAAVVAKVARAVHFAHQRGILHRDLKPANVLLDADGTPYVADFGLARRLEKDFDDQTRTGEIVGTPSYMAPEQARAEKQLSIAVDVYSLGAILYELISGRPPFLAGTALETVQLLQEREPDDPGSVNPQADRDLSLIALKCLRKQPSNRYGSAAELADDLERWSRGEPIQARPVGRIERGWSWCRRHPAVAALTGGIAVVLLVGSGVATVLALVATKRANDLDSANTTLAKTVGDLNSANTRLDTALAQSKTNEDLADKRADEALAAVEQLQVANGLRAADEGQFYQALRWFALPLKGEGANSPRAKMHRNRLSNHWRPPQDINATRYILTQFLQHQANVLYAEFSPDGRLVVTASRETSARIWDVATGLPVGQPLEHDGYVEHAAFSPDGRRVVTASMDNKARVWDAATGKPAGPTLDHLGMHYAAFSPDGRRVVTASLRKTAQVWDAATGQPVGAELQHQGGVWRAAFSPDGSRVVTASEDKTARIWDAATGQSVGVPLQHKGYVWRAAFSPDGRRVVTASFDNTARVWDAVTGKPVGPPLQHQEEVFDAAFSPDGGRVVTASVDKTARVWDAATGQPIGPALEHSERVGHVAFSPDGRRVVSSSRDKTARVWDAVTGQPVGPPLQHQGEVNHAAFSADGRRIVTASIDQIVRVWDAAAGQPVSLLRHHDHVLHAEFNSAGDRVVTASSDKTARVWDAATGKSIGAPLVHDGIVRHAAFSPNGRRVVTASWDSTARVWEATTGKPVGLPISHRYDVMRATFSPDSGRVVTASLDKTARVWDADTGQPVGPPLQHESFVYHAAFSPDGRRVVTTSWDKTARVWDAATGLPVVPPLQHQHYVFHAAFSPDGHRVVTACEDHTARIWDAATGEPAGPPLQHQEVVRHAEFSPDGRLVVTASSDKTARIWDPVTGQSVGPPLQHRGYVVQAAFSPDSRRVITACTDQTARLWDSATGQPVGPALQHRGIVRRAAFSQDGRRALTASEDKTAQVWDVSLDDRPPEDWVRLTQFFVGEMDRFGAHMPLSPERLAEDWKYLRDQYPQDFSVTPDQARAWHRREAEQCLRERNTAAAVFHVLYAGDFRWFLP